MKVATVAFVRLIRRHWLTLVGVVVAVAGGLLLALARTSQFGWTSYAPPDSKFPAPKVLVFDQPQALIGLLLLVAGAAITGAGIAYSIARRRSADHLSDEAA
jgi:drug/metabolite transporter (DMT)-like permease